MVFLIREFFKSFIFSRKIKIGFVLGVFPSAYWGKIMASTRLRAYDVINNFNDDDNYFLELYKPWKKYDVAIFQKKFDRNALHLAQKLKSRGVKIILDINVNYYDPESQEKKYEYMHKEIMDFTKISDATITGSSHINNYVKKLFPEKNIICIPENITDDFFSVKKEVGENNDNLKLMYVGYAIKAKEVLSIEKTLKELREKYDLKLIFICEKNPKISLDGIETEFIKYNQRKIPRQMLLGDIFIAPRDLSKPYNLGHSFTKIGYPMAVGIPIVASRVPAYENSPAILCDTEDDWKINMERLLANKDSRKMLGEAGIDHCRKNYSQKEIKKEYEKFFKEIL